MPAPLVIAHRGASADRPENSLAAFRRAVELGADGIELDVHATADGRLVVRHDAQLGAQHIPAMSFDAVRSHMLPNGEHIPTLAEALDAAGPNLTVFVELKSLPPASDVALFAALDHGPAPAHYHVHGFDHRIIRRVHLERPSLVCGVLSASYPIQPLPQFTEAGATEFWQAESLLDEALVQAVHGARGRVYAWTVDEPAQARALSAMGVDGLCTNRPDAIRRALT